MKKVKKAILVVSFGTSYNNTREATIDKIEEEIKEIFEEYKIYRAWTSKKIIAKLKKRDNIHVMNVTEAMEQMKKDGIEEIIIQPTHVMNGIENDIMIKEAMEYKDIFLKINFGNPLLTTDSDQDEIIEIISEEFKELKDKEALILMGHGTTHYANSIYAALDYKFKDKGHKNIFLGTVEAYPGMENLKKLMADFEPEAIVLAPFMIVAGDHAQNDLAGKDEDSWESQFKKEGYTVRCQLKGLGEYPKIRKIFINHISEVL